MGIRLVLAATVLVASTLAAAPASAAAAPVPQSPSAVDTAVRPQVPVVVNGRRYTPAEFATIAPRVQYFVVTAEAQQQGILLGYTSKAAFDRQTDRLERESAARRAQAAASGVQLAGLDPWRVFYFEDINWGGEQISLADHQSIADLGTVGAHCVLFWCSANWNDRISSVATGVYNTRLYEHVNFRGVTLFIASYLDRVDLRQFGFNDRASSVSTSV